MPAFLWGGGGGGVMKRKDRKIIKEMMERQRGRAQSAEKEEAI